MSGGNSCDNQEPVEKFHKLCYSADAITRFPVVNYQQIR